MNDSPTAAGASASVPAGNCAPVTRCIMCAAGDLQPFLDLGQQPLANAFLRPDQLTQPEPAYPLRAQFCSRCHLVQLTDVVKPEVMFSDYLYFSSGMPAGVHWQAYARQLVERFLIAPDRFVVEIGSNDGHFLALLKPAGVKILGVDPAKNIATLANQRGIPTLPEFFSAAVARQIAAESGRADLVIANNVVAHVADHRGLLAGVDALLDDDGVFVLEAPHVLDMVENLAFDSIYHEHLMYLSLQPLRASLARFSLEVFDVELHPVQGQSLRVFAGRPGAHPARPSVEQLLAKERALGLHELGTYQTLARRIAALKAEVMAFLQQQKRQGKRLAAYGAPARGNTLLNYFGIGPEFLIHATEELPSKIGLYTPGQHLPIVHVVTSRQDPPDAYFLLAWNYLPVVMEKERVFRHRGGRFILPIGERRIV